MINLIALSVAGMLWLLLWSIGFKAFDAALLPVIIIVHAAAADTFIPLIKKTLHGESSE
ncbi:MAG: hypothetical protein WAP35_03670 [Solirubrobacterales bacterium]